MDNVTEIRPLNEIESATIKEALELLQDSKGSSNRWVAHSMLEQQMHARIFWSSER